MMNSLPSREDIAALLEEIAGLLDLHDANVFRVRSYRRAARSIRQSAADVADLARRADHGGLVALPGIGEALAGIIVEYATTGRSALRDELRGRGQEQG